MAGRWSPGQLDKGDVLISLLARITCALVLLGISPTLTAKAFDNLNASTVSAPVDVTITGAITYLHNDFAGNPIAATDAAGAILWKENFRPYGDRLNNQPAASGNRQWFHGKAVDADTGLSYFGARYYDPTLGRFMGIDPVDFKETNLHSFNRYGYGNNNPYKFVDPDGNSPVDVFFLVYDGAKLVGAIYTGVGVGAAALDFALSAVGTASPIPGTGQFLKGLRGADHLIDAASKGSLVIKEARGAEEIKGVYQFAEGSAQYVGQSSNAIKRLQRHDSRLGTDPQFIKITEVAGGKTQREIVESQQLKELGVNLRQVERDPKVTNKVAPISERRAREVGAEYVYR